MLISIFLIYIKLHLKENENLEIIQEEEIIENKEEINETKTCQVDIKGAVNNPGVYITECNKTVNDIISLSGGLKDCADTSLINLAKKIKDEMVIVIYTTEEVKKSNIVDTVIKVVEKECICPNIQNDGCINDSLDNTITNKPTNKDEISNDKLLDLNTVTLKELMDIPKIGESKAKAIIEYREKMKGFKDKKELLEVSGIGDKLYEEIKVYFK